MPLLQQDERQLYRALALAREAVGLASPNPTVGCVITRNDEVLGEGAHLYDNRDHAEIAALKQARSLGREVTGATAYVTLEPCSHQGRTGPCADALVAAGIARCVVATVDPNPQVSGSGIAKLRAAGVEVVIAAPASALAQEARRLNDAFAFSIQHGRPFVTLKAALSLDGKLAPPPAQRSATAPHWLTGPAARSDVQQLRHSADAILTGIGTILADDPSLTDRTGLPRRRPLLRVILDRALRTPRTSAILRRQETVISTEAKRSEETPRFAANQAATGAPPNTLIIASPEAPKDNEQILQQAGAEVLHLPSLPAVLAELASRDIRSVLLEAGSALNAAFLNAGLVDQVILYYAESELGTEAIPFAPGYSPYTLQQELQRTTRLAFPHGEGEDVRIIGYLHDPWPASL